MFHNLFSAPVLIGPAQAVLQPQTEAYLTCSGCKTESKRVMIPTGSLPESEWKPYALKLVGWPEDCPACEAKRK